jgi:hypothetical protein
MSPSSDPRQGRFPEYYIYLLHFDLHADAGQFQGTFWPNLVLFFPLDLHFVYVGARNIHAEFVSVSEGLCRVCRLCMTFARDHGRSSRGRSRHHTCLPIRHTYHIPDTSSQSRHSTRTESICTHFTSEVSAHSVVKIWRQGLREKVLHNLHTLHRTARSLRFSSVYSTDPHAQKIQAPTRSPSNHLSYLYYIISP